MHPFSSLTFTKVLNTSQKSQAGNNSTKEMVEMTGQKPFF